MEKTTLLSIFTKTQKSNWNLKHGKRTSYIVFTKPQKMNTFTWKKIKFILFLTKPQKISLICGNESVVIDFQKTKKIELTSNTSKKAISCFSNLIHVKKQNLNNFQKNYKKWYPIRRNNSFVIHFCKNR
jgi:hypothetical protein